MAIIEPEKEKFSAGPLILAGCVLLLMVGIGFGVYKMMSGPRTKTIKLTGEDAKKAGQATVNTPIPPGPPFPVAPPLPPGENPAPTLITLDLKNVNAAQAAAEIAKVSGVKINAGPQQGGAGGFIAAMLSQRFDFAVSNQPFWVVMDELSKKANLSPQPWEQGDLITLQNGASNTADCPTLDFSGSRLVLTGVTTRINADVLSSRANDRSLTVNMMLYVEPKLKPYRVAPIARIETAVDEKGNSLFKQPDYWDDRDNGGPRSKYVKQVRCLLNFPPNAGDRIARLKGYASIVVVGKDETVTVKDPLKAVNVDQTIDGQTIRVRRVMKQGSSSYEAQLQADANSPFFKDWESLPKVAKLYDASGKEFQSNGTGMGGGQKTVDFYLYFNADAQAGPPTELRLTLPTQAKEVKVPFDFTDLPLPH